MKTKAVFGLLLTWSFGLSACAREKIVTITFPQKDGSSEYWVCDRDARSCHGRGEGDLEPTLYKPGLDTLSPPAECDHDAARIEILIKGNQVVQIGYECAQPAAPTKVPGAGNHVQVAHAPGVADAPTGLPEAAPFPRTDEVSGVEESPIRDEPMETSPGGPGPEAGQ